MRQSRIYLGTNYSEIKHSKQGQLPI